MEHNNYKNIESGCDIYGNERLALALILHNEIFNQISIDYCLENGTLLGAYRDGKFIPHDDDFDYAVFIQDINQLDEVFNTVKEKLPRPYKCRMITSYCRKIEVYDPTKGKYILQGPNYNGADYHHVSVDLQFHLKVPATNAYNLLYHFGPQITNKGDNIFPVSTIILERCSFPAPNNTKLFLEQVYGSIERGAVYNSKTCKYEMPKTNH